MKTKRGMFQLRPRDPVVRHGLPERRVTHSYGAKLCTDCGAIYHGRGDCPMWASRQWEWLSKYVPPIQ